MTLCKWIFSTSQARMMEIELIDILKALVRLANEEQKQFLYSIVFQKVIPIFH